MLQSELMTYDELAKKYHDLYLENGAFRILLDEMFKTVIANKKRNSWNRVTLEEFSLMSKRILKEHDILF